MMNITATKLTRAAALCAVIAGLLYIAIQFVHPSEDVATVTSSAWATTGSLTIVMAVLGLVGVSGIYLRQVEETGIVGLLGYVLLGLFFLVTVAFTFAETLILPVIASDAPQFVENFLGIFNGEGTDGSLGALEVIGPLAGVLYVAGGVLFGVTIFRARILSRWAGILLAAGAVLALLTAFVPHSVGRLAAIPVGLALVWLGYSLWSAPREAASRWSVGTTSSQLSETAV